MSHDPPAADGPERTHRETAVRLRSLVDHHPHAVFALDVEGRFTELNPAGQQLSGYTEEELVGTRFTDLLPEEDVLAVVDTFVALLQRESRSLSVRFRGRSGGLKQLDVVGVPIVVDDEVTGIYGIAHDVTARERAQQLLQEARRSAEAANDAKSVFLATMSHEIRTPLTSVLAAAEMLADTELSDEQRMLVTRMERSGGRLLALVDEVLDFSRVEAGHAQLACVPFGLAELVDEVAGMMRPAVEERGLCFHVGVDRRVPSRLVGDPQRLAQVLTNLVGNAAKFTHAGEVRLQVDLLDADAPGDGAVVVRLVVSDTGIGMTEDQQRLVFELFQQADSSTTREYGGTGLGLAISRRLVQLMRGRIDVVSAPGRGSTFTVVVPLRRPAPPG